MNSHSIDVKKTNLELVDQISNAIIFREKILIIFYNDPEPCIYHPYYLLSLDDDTNFKVKGYRMNPKSMLNFSLASVSKCINLDEEFAIDKFPEIDATISETNEGYRLYMNINT